MAHGEKPTGTPGVMVEYEFTYLARFLPPGVETWPTLQLVDVYVPEDIDVHPRVRLRQRDREYEFTKKLPTEGSDASSHSEISVALTEVEFLALTDGKARRVEKSRCWGVIDGYRLEVDIFKGRLKGLVLIEVEFPNRNAMRKFSMPTFCLADVTQEDFIAGGLLAGRSFGDIADKLKEYGYEKIG